MIRFRPFDVEIVNATINPRVRLDTTDSDKICDRKKDKGDVLITEIEIPFKVSLRNTYTECGEKCVRIQLETKTRTENGPETQSLYFAYFG